MVGWRATENVFLQLLGEKVDKVRMMSVTGSSTTSRESMERLIQAGVEGNLLTSKSGFSDFVARREVESFLRV
jgi:hypothetical protein